MEQITKIFNTPKIATWQDKKGFNKLSESGEPLYIAQDGSETTSQYTEIEQDNGEGGKDILRFANYPALGEIPCERIELIVSAKLLSSQAVLVDNIIKYKVIIELTFADERFSHTSTFTISGNPILEDILLEHFNIEKE